MLFALLPLPPSRLREEGGRSGLACSRAVLDLAVFKRPTPDAAVASAATSGGGVSNGHLAQHVGGLLRSARYAFFAVAADVTVAARPVEVSPDAAVSDAVFEAPQSLCGCRRRTAATTLFVVDGGGVASKWRW